VLKEVGETETTQENIQDWLELAEGFQLLTEEEIAAVILFFFIYLFSSAIPILLHFPFILFLKFPVF
jgi:hypothetical protein